MSKTLCCALSLLLLAGCAADTDEDSASTEAAIKNGDATTDYPEAVTLEGDLGNGYAKECTGTLISPTVVLTAGHCVTGVRSWFVQAQLAGRTANAHAGATPYTELAANRVNPATDDVGLVFLDTPIQINASYPIVSHLGVAQGQKVRSLGRVHARKLRDDFWISAPNRVRDSRPFPHDYAAVDHIQPGDSGGAVVVDGTHLIVAVNSGAGDGTEVLARTSYVADWVDAQLSSHR